MKTDIRETDEGYEIMIDLPGFKKEEVKASLEDGYLTLSAAKGLDKSEEKKKDIISAKSVMRVPAREAFMLVQM